MSDINKLPTPNIPMLDKMSVSGLFDWAKNLVSELGSAFTIYNNKINKHCWQLINVGDITANATTYTISNLDGNSDIMYMIVGRFINKAGGAVTYYVRPNADSGANYGYQYIAGVTTTASAGNAVNDSGLWFGANANDNEISYGVGWLYAKSGYLRTMNSNIQNTVAGETIGRTILINSVWSNTADNITSLTITSVSANGIGIGSHIEVWAR